MTSPDGINWTSRTSAADNDWRAIAWSPELGLFAAVAGSGTGNRVMTSPDGINWTSRTSAANNYWFGIAWSSELGLFAAVAGSGTGNRLMTSPDGINWTSRTSAADSSWYGIAWSPELGLFAAIAFIGTNNRVMTSFPVAIKPYVRKTGDTMTGDLTFNNTQKIIGGTSTTADLTLQTTTGVGTTGADMHFLVGNNGATEAITILNSGNVGIGTTNPVDKLQVNLATDKNWALILLIERLM